VVQVHADSSRRSIAVWLPLDVVAQKERIPYPTLHLEWQSFSKSFEQHPILRKGE
jgi:hypothetical protein